MGPRRMRQSTAGQIEKDRLGTKVDLADYKCDLALDDNKPPPLPATNRIVNIKHKSKCLFSVPPPHSTHPPFPTQ